MNSWATCRWTNLYVQSTFLKSWDPSSSSNMKTKLQALSLVVHAMSPCCTISWCSRMFIITPQFGPKNRLNFDVLIKKKLFIRLPLYTLYGSGSQPSRRLIYYACWLYSYRKTLTIKAPNMSTLSHRHTTKKVNLQMQKSLWTIRKKHPQCN